MDPLETARNHGAHPEQACALRCPVARAAGAVVLSGDHHQRHAFGAVAPRRLVDSHPLAVGLVAGHAALDSRHHQIADAHVGERAADHHFVVPSPCAITVEIPDCDPAIAQVTAGR